MKQIFLLITLFTSLLNAGKISIVAGERCPYYCSADSKDKGFVIDIVEHVFAQYGYKITYTSLLSKEQAIADIREDRYEAIIDVTKKETPELIFAKHPIAYSYDVILVPKYSQWKYQSPSSLNSLKIGAREDYHYGKLIQQHILKHKDNPKKIQLLSGKYAMKHNLKKLRYEKITALVDNQHSLQYFYAKKKKLFPFKAAKKLSPAAIKIAFAPSNYNAQKYAQIFNRGIRKLQGSKEMGLLLKKYGLIEQNIAAPK